MNSSRNLKILLTVKIKFHLVVTFNYKFESSMIHKFYKAGISISSLNLNFSNTDKTASRTTWGFNFVGRNIKLISFFLFYALLKKTPLKKGKRL